MEIKVNNSAQINDKAEAGGKTPPAKPESTVVTWQFKKRNYQEITISVVDLSDKTRSGNRPKVVVRARNWRVDLDLTDPLQKKMHDHLVRRKDVNHEYYLLTDKAKTDKVSEEGATLKQLMEMSIPQLMNCITSEELISVGLMPSHVDKYQLVCAIMRKKKLA